MKRKLLGLLILVALAAGSVAVVLAWAGKGLVAEYRYMVSITLVNRRSTVFRLNMSSLPLKLVLAPSIPGWQTLAGYSVLVNGENWTGRFQTALDGDGNRVLVSREAVNVPPGGLVNVTLVQVIYSYVDLFGLGVFRTHATEESGIMLDTGLPIWNLTGSSGLWNYRDDRYDWSRVRELVRGSTDREKLLNIVRWIEENVQDTEPGLEIRHPTATVERGSGACGDQAALLVAALRIAGIPSFTYFAAVYSPGAVQEASGGPFKERAVNIRWHIFAMASLNGVTWFPVDTTFHRNGGFTEAIRGAAVNVKSDVLVVAQIATSNLNDFLSLVAPEDVEVRLNYSLSKTGVFERFLQDLLKPFADLRFLKP